MFDISIGYDILAILLFAGAVAGFVDAMAGGGGLITVPVLLLAGLPPLNAIATNKFQGVFGTLTASITVFHKNIVQLKDIALPFIASLVGSTIGAVILLYIDVTKLEIIIPIVLLAIALYFIFSPQMSDKESTTPKMGKKLYRFTIIPLIGFYDGILGPGTGSFFATAGVALRGQTLVKSTSVAKFLNFASNFAALVIFIFSGKIIWMAGFVMIIGQIIGGYLGSLAVISGGAKYIRPLIIVMSLAMTAKYLHSIWW